MSDNVKTDNGQTLSCKVSDEVIWFIFVDIFWFLPREMAGETCCKEISWEEIIDSAAFFVSQNGADLIKSLLQTFVLLSAKISGACMCNSLCSNDNNLFQIMTGSKNCNFYQKWGTSAVKRINIMVMMMMTLSFWDWSDWISVATILPPFAQQCQDKHFDIWHYLTIGNKSLWRSNPNFERMFSWGIENASYPLQEIKQRAERGHAIILKT